MISDDVETPEKADDDLLMAMIYGLRQSVDRTAVAIAELSPEKRRAVSELCTSLGMPRSTEVRILVVLCELIDFKRARVVVARTPKERVNDLMDVAAASRSLFDAIAKLSLRDSFNLHMGAMEKTRSWPENAPEKNIPTPTAAQLETVGVVAQFLAASIADKSAPGGSRPTLEIHAAAIAQIWRAVCKSGMKPGGGGPFERLCNAIFQLAGVPSAAQGAIKLFKKKFLPTLQRGGVVGAAFEAALDAAISELMDKTNAKNCWNNPATKADG